MQINKDAHTVDKVRRRDEDRQKERQIEDSVIGRGRTLILYNNNLITTDNGVQCLQTLPFQ